MNFAGGSSKVEFALLEFKWREKDCEAWAEMGMSVILHRFDTD